MSRDQFRLAAALAILLLGAAVLTEAWRKRGEPAGELRVAEIDPRAVTAIAVHGPSTWQLLREGEAWTVVSEGQRWPADRGQALELVDAVVEAGVGVPVPDVDSSAVGLDAPVRVEVASAGVHRFEVGGDAPVGGRTWIRVEGAGVIAVQGGIGDVVRSGPAGLVERDLAPDAVDGVRLEGPDGAWEARRGDAGWTGTPEAAPEVVSAWVEEVLALSLASLDPAPAPPSHTLVLHAAGGEQRIALGRGGAGWWARAPDGRCGLVEGDVSGWVGGFDGTR